MRNRTDHTKTIGKVERSFCMITDTEIVGRDALKTYLGVCTRYTTEITNKDPTFPKAEKRKTGCTRVSVWKKEEVDTWREFHGR
jgi:predicted DNA-binding transcriptional regulator AlpA